jgi:hypothetical protein
MQFFILQLSGLSGVDVDVLLDSPEFIATAKEAYNREGLPIDDTGSEVELDVIGLCCEYSEDTPEEIAENYGIELEDDGNELNNVLDYLHDHTMVCGVTKDGSIVYQSF